MFHSLKIQPIFESHGRDQKSSGYRGWGRRFFAALSVAEHHPNAQITLYEKSTKVLSKVKISGGGVVMSLITAPISIHLFKPIPEAANNSNQFFTPSNPKTPSHGLTQEVLLKTEEDGRMFPITDNSQTIIDC